MKKTLIFFLLIAVSIVYFGCDDAGIILPFVAKGNITFTPQNLKPLDQNVDGMYELWISLDTAGITTWYSAGQFNVSSTGSLVDASGNSAKFVFTGDTNRLGLSSKVLVTIEKGQNGVPGTQRLMSGTLAVSTDTITGLVDVSGTEAFGNVGTRLLSGEGGKYIRWSPSTNNLNSRQGIWLCDSNGTSFMPAGIDLPVTGGWIYQAWLVDTRDNSHLSIGKFFNPRLPDMDLAGPCSGNGAGFNVPGQDWILTGGTCPASQIDVISGNYNVVVTLEPSNELPGSQEDNSASPYKIYSQHIDPSLGPGQLDVLYSLQITEPLPTANIIITNNSK